ncbi:MAG: pyridoxamine 5'-phosphate oxidase family protein [Actinomycetia bacterium]|nr:pyridoxamine 5'-phosphate oxidase family protein [Actinomycetes bacterium]
MSENQSNAPANDSTANDATTNDAVDTVRSIMESTRIASLTYLDDQGRLVATPMGTQDFTEPGTTYWITERDSDKVRHLQADNRVNVFYSSSDGYVSLAGTAQVIDDPAKLKELWGMFTGAFMDEGPEDPNSVLIRVDADSAQWWDTPNAVSTVVRLITARLTDGETDLGDSGITRL